VERYGERLLSGGGVELARLRGLELLGDNDTRRWLTGRGVGHGWRCLEVGGGAGSVATWLADQGADVTVTDLDTRYLDDLAARGVRVLTHDVTVDDAPGTFDLIHARSVLEHLPQRVDVLQRLADWLAPGGWLVVEAAVQVPSLVGHSAHARFKEAREALFATRIGADMHWGRHLPAAVRATGLTNLGSDGALHAVRGGTDSITFDQLTLERLADELTGAGLLTAAEVAAAFEVYADPSFVDHSIGVIAAWGQR
jgi:SAM-dependent methyltransferase